MFQFKFKFLNNKLITVLIMLTTLFALITILRYFNLYEGMKNQDEDENDYDASNEDDYETGNIDNLTGENSPKINLYFFNQDKSKRKPRKNKLIIPTSTTPPSIFTNMINNNNNSKNNNNHDKNEFDKKKVDVNLITTTH